MTIVIVPPNTWHPIHTTGTTPEPNQPDTRTVTECYHTGPGTLLLTVSNNGTATPICDDPHCACHHYKLRTIPYEDHTYQQFVQSHRPAPTASQ